jgi:ABC-type bacteriocin/lantibiotic exporter with double-glycine peptidase domain
MIWIRLGYVLASLFIALGSACASTGKTDSPSADALRLDVPYFPQQAGLCGPASLTSVLTYWREEISVEEVTRAVYLPELNGALGMDLTRFARSKGMRAESYAGSLSDIKDHLSQGIPLIAFLNLGGVVFPVGHFVVITGLDEAREEVIVHSGSEENKPIPYQTFMAAWEKTNYWTLQLLPPTASSL